MTIQEQFSGFIVEQVIDPKGEFYYDGISNIDNHSKYDNIRVYIIKNEYTYVNIYVCLCIKFLFMSMYVLNFQKTNSTM